MPAAPHIDSDALSSRISKGVAGGSGHARQHFNGGDGCAGGRPGGEGAAARAVGRVEASAGRRAAWAALRAAGWAAAPMAVATARAPVAWAAAAARARAMAVAAAAASWAVRRAQAARAARGAACGWGGAAGSHLREAAIDATQDVDRRALAHTDGEDREAGGLDVLGGVHCESVNATGRLAARRDEHNRGYSASRPCWR